MDFNKCCYPQLSLIHFSVQFSLIMDVWMNGIKVIGDGTEREQKKKKWEKYNMGISITLT